MTISSKTAKFLYDGPFNFYKICRKCILFSRLLREKCPNTELFLFRIFLYSPRIQENTDQK